MSVGALVKGCYVAGLCALPCSSILAPENLTWNAKSAMQVSSNASAPRLVWKRNLPKQSWLAPVLVKEKVLVVASESFEVFGLSAESGQILWTFEARGTGMDRGFISGPLSDMEGRVFVGAKTRHVYVLDWRTGRLYWSFEAPSHVVGILPFESGKVLVCSADGTLFMLSREDGAEFWQTKVGGPLRVQPVRLGKYAMLVTREGTIIGLNLETGETIWMRETGCSTRWGALASGPRGTAVLTTDQSRVFVVNVSTGQIVLERSFREVSDAHSNRRIHGQALALESGDTVLSWTDGTLTCVDLGGALKWSSFVGLARHEAGTQAGSPSLLSSKEIVVAGGLEGFVIVEAKTGRVSWRALEGTCLTTPVHVSGRGRFFFATGDTAFAFERR